MANPRLNEEKTREGDTYGELQCPTCLLTFQSPRALACLHTFCETCLEANIAESKTLGDDNVVTNIECPICQHPTTISKGYKSPAAIAKSLPLNHFILPRLNGAATRVFPVNTSKSKKKSTLSSHQCGPCADRKRSVEAEAYCNSCGEYQCEKCVEGHSKVKQFRDHTILFIETAKTGKQKYEYKKHTICKHHPSENAIVFCSNHDTLICTKCVVESHRSCDIVNEFKSVGNTLKGSKQPKQLLENLKEIQTHLTDTVKIIQANDDDMTKECDDIMETLESAKSKMLRLFRTLENSTAKRIREFKSKYGEKNAERIQSCKQIAVAIESSCETLNHVVEMGADDEAFSVFQTLKQQLFEYDDIVSQFQDSLIFRSIGLTLNDVLITLLNANRLLGEIDEVDVAPDLDELPVLRFAKKAVYDIDDTVEEQTEVLQNYSMNEENKSVTSKIQESEREQEETDRESETMENNTVIEEEQTDVLNEVQEDAVVLEDPPKLLQNKSLKFDTDTKRKCTASGMMEKKLVLLFEVRSKLRVRYQISFFSAKTLEEIFSYDIQKDPKDLVCLDGLNVVVSYPNNKAIEFYKFSPPLKKRKKKTPASVSIDKTVKCEIYDTSICKLNAEEFGVTSSSYFGIMTHDGVIKRTFYFSRSLRTQETNFWSTQLVVKQTLYDGDREILYILSTKPDKLYSFTLTGEFINVQHLNASPTDLDFNDDGEVIICCGNTSSGSVVKMSKEVKPRLVDVELQLPSFVSFYRKRRTMFLIENYTAATNISKFRFPKKKTEEEEEAFMEEEDGDDDDV